MNLLDVAENSVAAGAGNIRLSVLIDPAAGRLRLAVEDDGRGMDEKLAKRVTDPFCTSRTIR